MKMYFARYLTMATLVFGLGSSCTKYYNPPLEFEEYEQEGENTIKRKMMIISIDGLVGEEIQKKAPKKIAAMMESGKYSFQALTDEISSDAATWTTMMTGYNSGKHHVLDENYLPSEDPDDPHGEVDFSPTIFNRIESQQPSLSTIAMVRDEPLANILLMDADQTNSYPSDEAVKTAVTNLLKNSAPDFTVLQFTDVLQAGKDGGFLMSNQKYDEALQKIDDYIAEILEAIESRDNAEFENWLVVITSNHGGLENGYGGDSYQERNIFTLYYQKDLIGQEIIPEIISSPRLYGYDGQESGPKEGVRARNAEAENEEDYNVDPETGITIEAKIKVNRNDQGNFNYIYPPFLSKTNGRTGATPGWSFFRAGNNVAFWMGDGGKSIEISGGPVSIDDQWAHLTGTIEKDAGGVKATLYVNGVKATEKIDALNIANIKSDSPLTFGFQPYVFLGGFIDLQMADVHIWNTVLSADEIMVNARRVGIEPEHAKYDHLKGFWPMNDGDGILRNQISGKPNIALQGDFKYKVTNNNLPYVDENAILMQNLDLTSQALYWLGITPQESWALEGKSFLSNYELEFIK